ncbi:hypothetical protein ACFPK9_01095 [Rubritalea spongiae]|uniref:Uncharacterized protein n=1 Tax=Rubritalea spongiae TaxID=430797 RepID=A0ABW5DYN9_9BACT
MHLKIYIELVILLAAYFIGEHFLAKTFSTLPAEHLNAHLILHIAWVLFLSLGWCAHSIYLIRKDAEQRRAQQHRNNWKRDNRI